MTADLVIRNGWLVDAGSRMRGGLAIRDGRIVAVGPDRELPQARHLIDAREQFVIPGCIDAHVHMSSEEDASVAEGLEANLPSETLGMLHGGVTTFGHFVGAPGEPLLERILATVKGIERWSETDAFLHAYVFGPPEVEAIGAAWECGVASFKHFYTAYGRGAQLHSVLAPVETDVLLRSMRRITALGPPALAMAHCEDGDLIEAVQPEVEATGRTDLEAWSLSRPAAAEHMRVDMAIALAAYTGCPLYVVHVSTTGGVRSIARARSEGLAVWGEVGPHWLTHDGGMEEHIGCWGKVNPPLRTRTDSEALWSALRELDVLCLGTDSGTGGRIPQTKERGGGKHGNIWAARPGIRGGYEHALPVLMTFGVRDGRLSMEELVRMTSAAPARAFGLTGKGRLAVGADADVLVVDTERTFRVDEHFYRSVCEVSVYEGYDLVGMPRVVVAGGTVVVDEFEIAASRTGRYIPRGGRRPN